MFPSTQFIITGVLGPSSNAHGPNEFLHIESVTGRPRRARTCRCSLPLRGACDRSPLAAHTFRSLAPCLFASLGRSVCALSPSYTQRLVGAVASVVTAHYKARHQA
jgi:hypothetical protein